MRPYAGRLSCRAVAFWVLCGFAGSAWAAEGAPSSLRLSGGVRADLSSDYATLLFDFDIPAQSLNAALNEYAEISGQPALFPSDLVGGRTSNAVRGRYSAEAALNIMLQGVGLIADKRNSGLGQTFVLKEAAAASAASRNGLAEFFSEDGYAGLVQMRVWQALCANVRTRPGDYSSLLRFYLQADGRIGGARLIGTSGDARRDAAMLDALRSVRIDRSPPAAIVRKPLTMTVAPNAPDAGPRCGQGQEAG